MMYLKATTMLRDQMISEMAPRISFLVAKVLPMPKKIWLTA